MAPITIDESSAAAALPESLQVLLAQHSMEDILKSEHSNMAISGKDVYHLLPALWAKYLAETTAIPERSIEHAFKELRYDDKVMQYTVDKIGPNGKPCPPGSWPLYIALHGGGGTTTEQNNSQWEDMRTYYRASVTQGLYVVPRAVTDTWDLHFRPESYILYDRLIQNMFAFEGADPNRVYMLGFSAGSDGVYQIVPRMADRWAAAGTSAGHPNGVSLRTIANVPFLISVGEHDFRYNRNRATAEYASKLAELAKESPGAYAHEVNIHAGRAHNFRDNDPQGASQAVMADPHRWLTEGDKRTVKRNTNALTWVSQYTRNPLPTRVVWDLITRADREGKGFWTFSGHGQQMYWLDVGAHTATTLGTNEVEAILDRDAQRITVKGAKTYLRILLTAEMLDLDKSICVDLGEQKLEVRPERKLKYLVGTLLSRGDYSYMFEAAITLREHEDVWTAEA